MTSTGTVASWVLEMLSTRKQNNHGIITNVRLKFNVLPNTEKQTPTKFMRNVFMRKANVIRGKNKLGVDYIKGFHSH